MASSLFTNTLHVCFDSVLAMDNPGMVSMFEALMASGLSGFLGCPAVLYEDALTEFFLNGSVWDGKVVSTIRGKQVEISEELFASTFELPVDGLKDLSKIPKDIVFDARSIFSFSGEQVSASGKKREMKFEFRLLSDILAKTISVKARLLFNILKDMVTAGSRQAKGYAIQISLLLENVTNLELGDSSEFPYYKILTKKTVHRYIAVNDKVGVEEVTDVPRVKKTPVKKAVSRKRPAAVDEPIVKKKRTRVGKSAPVATDSALEAVPVQVVVPISIVPPPAPKSKMQKRKRRLALDSDDEIVGEPTTVAVEVSIENIVEEQRVEMPVDPVDQIIEQVIAETAQIESDLVIYRTTLIRTFQGVIRRRGWYGPFNPYIPIRSTTIGKSRVAIDPIAMRASWRLNSDITSVTSIGYPRMSARGESSTTMHRLLHASGSHPIPPPDDPNIGYPRMSASGESSTTIHRLLHASGSHPIPTPYDPKSSPGARLSDWVVTEAVKIKSSGTFLKRKKGRRRILISELP
ncbi:hypothetical protein F511_07241 [Dorcoceras hygrometricum]|uniref:Dystroglycan-like n=1 Tax=Dorcoceras hygrometricum TaxID=472368 RepID=A0A2Z7B1G8_9LAMI|nr:hypothetical protein F511_07241 [Dorcoceras hygrometricum]